MNYGEIKTAFYSALGEASDSVSLFGFGEAVNSAQLQLCSMLPLEAAPELMVTMFIDRSGAVVSEGSVQLPPGFYSLEFVQFATSRAADGSVARGTARVVSPEEFELLTSYGTSELIASVTSHLVRFSPLPVSAGDPGQPKAIKMVYKRRPTPYMRTLRVTSNGTFGQLRQHNDAPRVFDVLRASGAALSLDDLGVSSVDDLSGGRVFIGPVVGDAAEGTVTYEATVVDAIDASPVQVVVSEEDQIPGVDDVTGTTTHSPCLLLPRKMANVGTSMLHDEDIPDMDGKWHPHLIDLAVARILISLKDYNGAAAILQLLNQKMQAMGMDVFFTMPETREEKGGR